METGSVEHDQANQVVDIWVANKERQEAMQDRIFNIY